MSVKSGVEKMNFLKISYMHQTVDRLRRQAAIALSTPLYRNGYALILSSATTSGLGLLYWALAARFYSPEVLGLSSAALSAIVFLAGVSQLSLNGVLLRFISQAGNRTMRLVGTSYLISALLAIPTCLIFFIGLNWWAPSLQIFLNSSWKLVFFTLATISWSIFVLQDSAFAGLRQSVWVPLENTLFALVKIGLLILFIGLMPQFGIFTSWVIPVILTLLPVNLLIFNRLIPRHVASSQITQKSLLLQQVFGFIGGNYIGSLFFLAYTTLVPILVTEVAGPAANAHFYLPWTIITSLQLVSVNMTMSLTVEAANEQDKMYIYGRRVLLHVFAILGPIVLAILLGAPYFMRIFGKEYAVEGATLIRILALGLLPHLLISLSISLARVKNRARSILFTQAALCIMVLGLSHLLLPRLGINGVGIAWLASYIIVAFVLAVTELRSILIPMATGQETTKSTQL
jgi:O-antigen/teichoic acid export membrane protein